jgi:hypothetical protein
VHATQRESVDRQCNSHNPNEARRIHTLRAVFTCCYNHRPRRRGFASPPPAALLFRLKSAATGGSEKKLLWTENENLSMYDSPSSSDGQRV